MSRKRLTTSEMLFLSAQWLNPESPANKAILASPDLAPTLPRLQSAHQDLSTAAQPTALNPRLFEVIKEQTDIDDRHDDIIRGIHGLLTSTALLLGNPDNTDLLSLRDQLIPDGLASVQKSYTAEAGDAAQLAARFTPEIRSKLDKFFVGPKSAQHKLSQYLDEWIQLGAKLGSLEIEKIRLNSNESTGAVGTTITTARNKWIRNVNLFLAVGEAVELDPDTDHLIFGPLRSAESKADRRSRSASPTPETTPDPTPEDDKS
jgi:hypothetical protein